jgi:hypothetical protein
MNAMTLAFSRRFRSSVICLASFRDLQQSEPLWLSPNPMLFPDLNAGQSNPLSFMSSEFPAREGTRCPS